ncbi:outer membrane beta-barrel protein [Bacteroidota bacterium]
MKQFLLVFLLSALAGMASSQNFEGGALIGLTASQIDGDNYKGYNKVGLQGGGWVRRMFTYTLGGHMEIRYVQKGALKTNTVNDPTYLRTTLHNIDIPIVAQYFYNEDVVIELGLGPEILISARMEDRDSELEIPDPQYNRFTLSAIAGVGYRFFEVYSVHFRFNYSMLPIRAHPSGQTYLLNQGHYSNVLSIAFYYQIGIR